MAHNKPNHSQHSQYDILHMSLALEEGRFSLVRGDYPVGAVLVIDGVIVGRTNNSLLSKKTWGDHAETKLLLEYSQVTREAKTTNQNAIIELYTTLEPCLMCLGCATMHRVTRIVFSLHDPGGGTTHLNSEILPGFYKRNWPAVSSGVFREDTYDMFHQFMSKQEKPIWKANQKLFEQMRATWD